MICGKWVTSCSQLKEIHNIPKNLPNHQTVVLSQHKTPAPLLQVPGIFLNAENTICLQSKPHVGPAPSLNKKINVNA